MIMGGNDHLTEKLDFLLTWPAIGPEMGTMKAGVQAIQPKRSSTYFRDRPLFLESICVLLVNLTFDLNLKGILEAQDSLNH